MTVGLNASNCFLLTWVVLNSTIKTVFVIVAQYSNVEVRYDVKLQILLKPPLNTMQGMPTCKVSLFLESKSKYRS